MLNLTQIGIRDSDSESDKRQYYYNNLLNLVTIAVMTIVSIGDIFNHFFYGIPNFFNHVIYLSLSCTCLLNLFLNLKRFFHYSKVLLAVYMPVCLFILVPFYVNVESDAYFWYPYIPNGTVIVLYYLFFKKEDQKLLAILVLSYLLFVIFSYEILNLFVRNEADVRLIIEKDLIDYKVIPVVVFLFINGTMYYAFRRIRKFEERLIKTEKLLLERNQELEELNASKNKFHSIIAHDLRGPFNSIKGLSEILSNDAKSLSKEEIQKYSSLLFVSSKNTCKLLENLLDWSRVQAGDFSFNPESIDLDFMIKEIITLNQQTAQNKNIGINYISADSSEVYVDRNMINTVIRNLVSNGLKFTPKNGKITIKAKKVGKSTEVEVIDSGVGMSEEVLRKIFMESEKVTNPGTENEKGTGLGLMLCKEFVEKHGGGIQVTSEIDKGSNFKFNIPDKPNIDKVISS